MAEYLLYIFVTSVTPGPNCIISLSNASRKGFPKCLSLNLGMLTGIIIIDTCAFFLVSFLVSFIPTVKIILQILGIIYLLYLSWCLLKKGHVSIGDSEGGFKTGLLMQFANVKVLMLGVTSVSIYVLNMMKSPLHGFLLTMIVPFVCFISGLVWAIAGSILSGVYNKYTKAFNIGFAGILLIQAVLNTVKIFA